MKFEIEVKRRVVDGDEFGPCEYVLKTNHPDGKTTITVQGPCPGEAFRDLLCDLAIEKVQAEGL